MKKNVISKVFKILGISLIVIGIVLAVIPMFKFNAMTFKLVPVIIFALGFPFVGFVLFVIGMTIKDEEMMDNTIEKAKQSLTNEKEKKKVKLCKYCKSKLVDNKCPNCGASEHK